jgi:hypothetical protein
MIDRVVQRRKTVCTGLREQWELEKLKSPRLVRERNENGHKAKNLPEPGHATSQPHHSHRSSDGVPDSHLMHLK